MSNACFEVVPTLENSKHSVVDGASPTVWARVKRDPEHTVTLIVFLPSSASSKTLNVSLRAFEDQVHICGEGKDLQLDLSKVLNGGWLTGQMPLAIDVGVGGQYFGFSLPCLALSQQLSQQCNQCSSKQFPLASMPFLV